jgi:ABC-type transport system involved in multi-copper enzyme maturation permease subunit
MILETPILPFGKWLLANLPAFLGVLLALGALGLFFAYATSTLRHGPLDAFRRTARAVVGGVRELFQISLRRILAMAWLAFQESLRSKVLVAFALFLVLLLVAGWYLDVESDTPERLYLSFVLQSTNYLVLILAMFLSSFSLPNDLKYRTIYTVVTKPVRAWEIVLGRILGFVAMGTVLTALMWASSYVFVVGGLRHSHQVDLASITDGQGGSSGRRSVQGQTTLNSQYRHTHRHNFLVDEQGQGSTDRVMSHWHQVTRTGTDDNPRYEIGPPRDALLARVPVMGKLRYLDANGEPAKQGINVGKEWGYRGYIEGGTKAAAIWTFAGVTQRDFPRGLSIEMTIRVFRTYVGDIERGITGTIVLRNPENPQMASAPRGFTAREFTPQEVFIERELTRNTLDGRKEKIDLFDDLVADGQIEVVIQCMEPQQYYGMAPADLYLRAGDRWFGLNFAKGYLSIWFQMLMVTGFGVMFSTFLSGPVAMLATLATIVTGFFTGFIVDVATGEAEGGGPIEATIRIFKQMNLVTPLEEGASTSVVQGVDSVVLQVMQAVAFVLPDFGAFSTTHFVAYGFNVPGPLVVQHLVTALAYTLVVTCAGYFLLKSREIAA